MGQCAWMDAEKERNNTNRTTTACGKTMANDLGDVGLGSNL